MTDGVALPLTTRTRVALAIARGTAAAFGHDDVTPVHVALGLLREAENPAVAVLHRAGVNLRDLRHELEQLLPPRGRTRPDEVALPLTAGEESLARRALAEARLLDSPFLGSEHFLLAILRDPATPAAQAFARHGLTPESALAHLPSVYAPPP